MLKWLSFHENLSSCFHRSFPDRGHFSGSRVRALPLTLFDSKFQRQRVSINCDFWRLRITVTHGTLRSQASDVRSQGPVNPVTDIFRSVSFLFLVSLSWNSHQRAIARMSIPIQLLLSVNFSRRMHVFSKHVFTKRMLLLRQYKRKLFLRHENFIYNILGRKRHDFHIHDHTWY